MSSSSLLARSLALAAAIGPLSSVGTGYAANETRRTTMSPPSVDPDGGMSLSAPPYSSGTVSFAVTNNDPNQQTMYIGGCDFGGAVTSCSAPSWITIDGYGFAYVDVSYSTGGVGAGTVGLTVYSNGFMESDYGWYNINVTDGHNAPTLDLTPYNGENRSVGFCVSGCFDGRLGFSTPSYVSLDVPRSVGLVYSSATASPRVTVQVDATDASTTTPAKMSIRILRPDLSVVTQTNGQPETFYTASASRSRLAAQFDATGLSTGAYDYSVVVKSYWTDGSTRESSAPLKALVVNETSTPLGAGWMVAGLQRLYVQSDNALVIAEGGGSVARFPLISCPSTCSYSSPAGDFSTVTRRSSWPDNVKWDRRSLDGTTAAFFSDGRMAYVQDRFGNRTSFSYDGSGRLSQVTDPISRATTFTYFGTGSTLSSIADPMGRTTYTTVDGGHLTYVRDPMGLYPINNAIYDGSHRLTQWTDRRFGQWNIAYDAAGKVSAATMPTVNVDGEGSVRPAALMKSLESAAVVFSGGTFASPATRIDPDTMRATVMNARGYTTKFALDRFGNSTRIEEPLGRTTVFQRDESSRVTQSTSPTGNVVTYYYSGPNLFYSYNYSTGYRSYYYESTYKQDTLVIGNGDTVRKRWSGGKLDSMRVNNSGWTKFTYDSRGRLLTQTDPGGHQTSKTYLATGMQNVRMITVAGRTEKFGYDAFGRLIADTAPTGGITRHQYDDVNRDTLVIGPLSDTTITTYDQLYVTAIRDAKGQTYGFTPNALGWVERRLHPDPSLAPDSTRYDRNGNATWQKSRQGRIVTFAYDALDRPTARTADGQTSTFNISPAGLFSAAGNADSRDSVSFDILGRPVAAVTTRGAQTYTLTSTFESHGLRTGLSIAGPWSATIGWHYNDKLQLDLVTDIGGGQTYVYYNADFLPSGMTLPTSPARAMSMAYPALHTPSSITYDYAGINSPIGVSYNYAPGGEINQRIDIGQASPTSRGGREFGYDLLRRLTNFNDFTESDGYSTCPPYLIDENGNSCMVPGQHNPSNANSWTYDLVGNRTDSSARVISGNRLTRFRGDTMTYDADGNLTRRWRLAGGFDQSYGWNALGQLVSVTTNGSTVTFKYDATGRRIQKTGAGGTSNYLWDGDNLYAELDASGNRVVEYTYYPALDKPHSARRWSGGSSAMYYYATDYPGQVVGLINGSGELVNQYRYRPFGDLDAATVAVTNSLQFGAREVDVETGLYYQRARYYDPWLQRFISEDPIGLKGGINLYAFAADDPINSGDPTGTWTLHWGIKWRHPWRDIRRAGPIVAFAAIALATGGTASAAFAAAGKAVGAAALGSAASAYVESAISGRSFASVFERNLDYASWFLAANVALAPLSGGFAEAGANGPLQGYVRTKQPFLNSDRFGGALTFGSATLYNGSTVATYGAHELGHTAQMILLSELGRNPWIPYLGLGAAGLMGEWKWSGVLPEVGCAWENFASHLGNDHNFHCTAGP
jgi:RHS repeat-associated protein